MCLGETNRLNFVIVRDSRPISLRLVYVSGLAFVEEFRCKHGGKMPERQFGSADSVVDVVAKPQRISNVDSDMDSEQEGAVAADIG